jgi:hypothetical protein
VQISAYKRETESPYEGGHFADVFFGEYNDRKVIVKVLKVYSGDDPPTKEKRTKVGLSDYSVVAS